MSEIANSERQTCRPGIVWLLAIQTKPHELNTSLMGRSPRQGLAREYSPRNESFQVIPLSVDFSQVCSTLFGASFVTFTRFNTVAPSGPRLVPSNSAEPAETLPDVNT